MKILIGSTPATGHLNPMLAIARILVADGHEVAVYTGSAFRARVEAARAEFFSLPPDADLYRSSVSVTRRGIPESACV
jgi:UDP:flavonoid glycosyltransferase YjiC (YdhE family)